MVGSVDVTPMVTTVLVQVIEFVIGLTVAWGTSVPDVTATVDWLIQPVLISVATKVNVPGAQAVVVNVFIEPQTPPCHVTVDTVGDTVPAKVTAGPLHVMLCVAPAEIIGVDKLLVTVATAVLVQPLGAVVVNV